jgi:hypothetical protein
MTQEQKRIMLAKYAFIQIPDQKWALVKPLPDYFNDLNAVHELEKVLTEKGVNAWWEYVDHISRLNPTPFGRETAVHATAAQRAEAIGLTLNLWTA